MPKRFDPASRPDLAAKLASAMRSRKPAPPSSRGTGFVVADAAPRKRSKVATGPDGLPAPRESTIQTHIMGRLRSHGWMVVRFNGGGFTDKRGQLVKNYIIQGLNSACGFPDVAAFRDDRVLLCEIKTATGQLSAPQQRFANFAAHFGIKVHVLRSTDELDALLDSLKS